MPNIDTTRSEAGVLTVLMRRSEIRNAFDGKTIDALTSAFQSAAEDVETRLVVLRGEGPIFCAGGDIRWMGETGTLDEATRLSRARSISNLFDSIHRCPKPTVAVVQGGAFGGGVGLIAACDFVISSPDARFATSESRLGIVPACLAPFLLRKVGPANSVKMFVTGGRMSAVKALDMGLVDYIAPSANDIDSFTEEILAELLESSPAAQINAKMLLRRMSRGIEAEFQETLDSAARVLAQSWASEDGQEGMTAFVEKRRPQWKQAL